MDCAAAGGSAKPGDPAARIHDTGKGLSGREVAGVDNGAEIEYDACTEEMYMIDFQKYKEQQLEDPEFRKEYEALEDEMNAIRAQINHTLRYKGYTASIAYDAETHMLHGKAAGISDLVLFEAADEKEIEKEFHEAVDGYLEFCKSVGKEAAKPHDE